LEDWNLQFLICRAINQNKANSEKLGLGIDNPYRMFFFLSLRMNKCLERANDRHFWSPGVVSYAMIPRCRPNSRGFFLIVTSIVYGGHMDHKDVQITDYCIYESRTGPSSCIKSILWTLFRDENRLFLYLFQAPVAVTVDRPDVRRSG
jgi:hypothetical protein